MTNNQMLAINKLRIWNFKAIRDSQSLKISPLTVFIGNNGAGKSSVIEGLEAIQTIAVDGLDKAMGQWRGFEYAQNMAGRHNMRIGSNGTQYCENPIRFVVSGNASTDREFPGTSISFHALTEITSLPGWNTVRFHREQIRWYNSGKTTRTVKRTPDGKIIDETVGFSSQQERLSSNESVISAETSIYSWQFVRLNPEVMQIPRPVNRVGGYIKLESDGANIAEYLLDIRNHNPLIIDGIVETLQYVLPYATDLQPQVTSELGRNAYMQLSEQNFKIPSWMFSTGTLRILALLALLRHPEPPPLIAIEEIENGLDPRTISLIVDEIREVVRTGRSQIIITTHSPYLLDLLPLESIVFVERIDGEPRFFRPQDDESVQRWSEEFAPGRLYTMGRFRHSS